MLGHVSSVPSQSDPANAVKALNKCAVSKARLHQAASPLNSL